MGLDRERFKELYAGYRECERIKEIGGGAVIGACIFGLTSLIITKGNATMGVIIPSVIIGAGVGAGFAAWKTKKQRRYDERFNVNR